jgi:putative DNA primase/helicase
VSGYSHDAPPSWGGYPIEQTGSPNGEVEWFEQYPPIEPVFIEEPLLQAATFHLLVGQMEAGKSALVTRWIAACTNGSMYGRPRNACWLTSEEDPNRIATPRLLAAGADVARVARIPDIFRMPRDIEWLRSWSTEKVGDVGLIAIDPLSNHIGAASTNTEEEVRLALQPLASLSGEMDVPILGTRHLTSKESRAGVLARILGSTAWPAVARVVIGVARDREDEDVIHARVTKGNVRRRSESGMRFRLEGAPLPGWKETVVRAVAAGVSHEDIDLLLERRRSDYSAQARDEVVRVLIENGGRMDSDVLDATVAARTGVAARTVRNVRVELGHKGWLRSYPERDENGADIVRWIATLTNAAPSASDLDSPPGVSPTTHSSLDQGFLSARARVQLFERDLQVEPEDHGSTSDSGRNSDDLQVRPEDPGSGQTSLLPPTTCPVCGSDRVGPVSGKCHNCGSKVADSIA